MQGRDGTPGSQGPPGVDGTPGQNGDVGTSGADGPPVRKRLYPQMHTFSFFVFCDACFIIK